MYINPCPLHILKLGKSISFIGNDQGGGTEKKNQKAKLTGLGILSLKEYLFIC